MPASEHAFALAAMTVGGCLQHSVGYRTCATLAARTSACPCPVEQDDEEAEDRSEKERAKDPVAPVLTI